MNMKTTGDLAHFLWALPKGTPLTVSHNGDAADLVVTGDHTGVRLNTHILVTAKSKPRKGKPGHLDDRNL